MINMHRLSIVLASQILCCLGLAFFVYYQIAVDINYSRALFDASIILLNLNTGPRRYKVWRYMRKRDNRASI